MSLFAELKRRNVFRVAIAYAVLGWVVLQGADFLLDLVGAPEWVIRVFAIAGLVGLPFALFFAWAYELTPEGIKREREVDRSQSITPQTGRKLDYVIIALLALGIVVLLVERFHISAESEPVVRGTDSAETRSNVTEATEADDASIAVLPFVNLSDDKDYFADGLSEELMNLLAKNPELKVAGRTSSFAFKGRNEDLRQIGEALSVNHVLEGSVRRSGDTLRITAQLINVGSGFHIWSETYDRQMSDIFAIQDDVASAIAHALRVRLSSNSSARTVDPRAYALYLEALPYLASNYSPDVLDILEDLLDRAIAIDPAFAKAYEAKALAYWMVSGELIDAATAARQFHEAATQALERDPSLVLARYYAEISTPGEPIWIREYKAITRALAAAPEDFDVVRAWCHDLINIGYLRQATACSEKMVNLEPLSPVSYHRLGQALGASGRIADAIESFSRAAGSPSGRFYLWDVTFGHLMAGEIDAAIASAEGDPHAGWSWSAADIRQVAGWQNEGDFDSIRSWVRATSAAATSQLDRIGALYWYLVVGLVDDYWSVIETMGAQDNYAWTDTDWLITYGISFPQTGFRSHPGFLEYARRSGLLDVWKQHGAPHFCEQIDGNWRCQ